MDTIFKALSDQTRRMLLDRLRERDGQTLTELESSSGLSRFGVMKHLKQLEDANLIVTRKVGRFKYHYLNAAPLQLLVDRWIEPLTRKPITRALLDLKADLERNETMTDDTKPSFVLETFIRASRERVWEALTDKDTSAKFMPFGIATHCSTRVGEAFDFRTADGSPRVTGTLLAYDPPSRLERSFHADWMDADALPSRCVYELEATGDTTKLTILHYGLLPGQEGIRTGWSQIAASLKSFLETGEGLKFA